ncbi:MAG: aspartyl/glutamyl-tRNA(Asn/Gln) amidotransferase subunit B [Patescibacteria group bacterium]|nr:MAG: aspartyl/glutamyl-tRNA(Asn/Gln) amidotransferase subunit B [Patescibacteria group bacterium]
METITTEKNTYKLVCGMEIHAELKTNSKMFCGCKNDPFGAKQPNIYTCPVCLGMPGGLPVANKTAIEWTIKVGLALGCKINLFSKFDRKNYFYPDLAKAYQISQYDLPFCYDGVVETSYGPVRITRIHLEEDTGKLQHTTINGKKVSLIDYNRSSVPLMEIVSEPDIHSPEQAKEYAKKIRDLLRYLEVADCDMDQGGMRLEANISLAEKSAQKLPNYKVEVKNINSFRFAEQAITYEMDRQAKILDDGKTPVQETRGFDSVKISTFSQRTKEDAEDYRYFPDPDLPPITFTQKQIDAMRNELPELIIEKISRWEKEFAVEPRYSNLLIDSTQTAQLLEEAFTTLQKNNQEPNKLANVLANKKLAFEKTVEKLVQKFSELFATDTVPESEILSVINSIMEANPDAVAKYKAGQKQVVGFFMGQTLRAIGKKIDTKELTKLLQQELEK